MKLKHYIFGKEIEFTMKIKTLKKYCEIISWYHRYLKMPSTVTFLFFGTEVLGLLTTLVAS